MTRDDVHAYDTYSYLLRLLRNLGNPRSLPSYINNLSLLVGMNKLVRMFPTPFLLTLLHSSMIDVTDNAASRYPHDGGNDYNGAYDVIFQKSHHFVNVYILDDVPKSFYHILDRFLTDALVAKALNTRCPVRQDILRIYGKACFIQTHSAASFARVSNCIAHAALQTLRFAIRNAFTKSALSSLKATRAILHRRRPRALAVRSSATRFLFARGVLCVATFHA